MKKATWIILLLGVAALVLGVVLLSMGNSDIEWKDRKAYREAYDNLQKYKIIQISLEHPEILNDGDAYQGYRESWPDFDELRAAYASRPDALKDMIALEQKVYDDAYEIVREDEAQRKTQRDNGIIFTVCGGAFIVAGVVSCVLQAKKKKKQDEVNP